VKDKISGLEDKVDIKEKTEEHLDKRLKSCERNMQKLNENIKRPNLQIMSIEEGEEVQAKEICNIFNKIVAENFPNFEKELSIQVQEASRTPKRLDRNRASPCHIIAKTASMENRESVLNAVREKKQTSTGKHIKKKNKQPTSQLKP
jgi:chromosome segregation ATPase